MPTPEFFLEATKWMGLTTLAFAALAALAEEGINIQMITTSEIKISVIIEEKFLELAVRALHSSFELDKEPEDEGAD